MNDVENNGRNTSTVALRSSNSTTSVNEDAVVNSELVKGYPDVVDVLIAGAGIGGLVTALCLHRAGFSVSIREQAQILEPTGFGLLLLPYCVKLLYELGLERELEEVGIRPRSAIYYSRNGQFICQEPRGIDAGYNWPVYALHRGHFQQLLLRHVCDEIGETSVQLSQKLVAFRSQMTHVEVDFVNTSTGQLTTELAKVLIGADGINSAVRKILYPKESSPLWAGLNVWRGVTPMDQLFLDGQTVIYVGNPHERFLVVYPVSSSLVNWAFVVRVAGPEVRASTVTIDWTNLGRIEDILPLLVDMKLDFLDVQHLIKSSIIINQFPMTDRDALPSWTHNRVTLLGDAAHPMYPYGGNGASQAILDARGLVLCFREHGVSPQALQAYDDLRRLPSHAVTLSTREYGVHQFLRVIDERLRNSSSLVSDVISTSEIEAILNKSEQQAGLNAQKLNQEPSLF
jgi:2-polyprenyl-6-methoxyphenol hydroxylase-like FAD-dependent oxidoreductase